MDYPNNFDIPSFPAGKSIALSRRVCIWISIVCFLIFCACGFILLGIHLKKNYPFLISINPFTNTWTVVAYPEKRQKDKLEQYQVIQKNLVHDFMTNWFTISGNKQTNELRWMSCSVDECGADDQFIPENVKCAISCKSDDSVFEEFEKKVLPEYRARITEKNERWTIVKMEEVPHSVTQNGSTWQVYTTINSTVNGQFDVLAFIKVSREHGIYPSTLGYYIESFNSYRISQ